MFYVIKHVIEEGPGLFEDLIPKDRLTLLATKDDFPDIKSDDTVLIMGGPMGVYEKSEYPFIEKELDFIKKCYERNVKVLGICLGAQMIAESLGGRVFRGHIKEIGWYEITQTEHAERDYLFSIFPKKLSVFQWHQDTFELPNEAIRLSENENYPNQAFKVGKNIYGLQYHIEVTEKILKEWFPESKDIEKYCNSGNLSKVKIYALEFFKRFLSL